MQICKRYPRLLSTLLFITAFGFSTQGISSDQLLRQEYLSIAIQQKRDFYLYLPVDYESDKTRRWPVIFFLHGHGERGDGQADLDYVLKHGPLMEAWIQRRPLPFIIISPQLPERFGIDGINDLSRGERKPRRLESGVPERNYGFKSDLPITRADADDFADGSYKRFDPYPSEDSMPAGWIRINDDIMFILDFVLTNHRADADRVYLTGVSYGGFGTFDVAAANPQHWAAIAPIVGTGKLAEAKILADARLPIWLIGGGKDTVIKPHWLYKMANALESAGHPALRFTVHEDMDHDAWKRAYEGEDLYQWFLRYSRDKRPSR